MHAAYHPREPSQAVTTVIGVTALAGTGHPLAVLRQPTRTVDTRQALPDKVGSARFSHRAFTRRRSWGAGSILSSHQHSRLCAPHMCFTMIWSEPISRVADLRQPNKAHNTADRRALRKHLPQPKSLRSKGIRIPTISWFRRS